MTIFFFFLPSLNRERSLQFRASLLAIHLHFFTYLIGKLAFCLRSDGVCLWSLDAVSGRCSFGGCEWCIGGSGSSRIDSKVEFIDFPCADVYEPFAIENWGIVVRKKIVELRRSREVNAPVSHAYFSLVQLLNRTSNRRCYFVGCRTAAERGRS